MKRSRLRRSSPDTIRAWRKRSKPIRRVNPERKAKLHERNFGKRKEAIWAMPCLVAEALGTTSQCWGRIEAAHAKGRKMGGCGGDRRWLVPLCTRHHEEAGERRGSKRAAFEEKYDLDLIETAQLIAAQLDERGYP